MQRLILAAITAAENHTLQRCFTWFIQARLCKIKDFLRTYIIYTTVFMDYKFMKHTHMGQY